MFDAFAGADGAGTLVFVYLPSERSVGLQYNAAASYVAGRLAAMFPADAAAGLALGRNAAGALLVHGVAWLVRIDAQRQTQPLDAAAFRRALGWPGEIAA